VCDVDCLGDGHFLVPTVLSSIRNAHHRQSSDNKQTVPDPVRGEKKKGTHTAAQITETTDIHGGDGTSNADIEITGIKVREDCTCEIKTTNTVKTI